MAGFRNVGAFAAADFKGQCWQTQFRKRVASSTTPTFGLIDYLYFSGSPTANFYASAPYVSAMVEANKGIYVPNVAPATQHLKGLTTMSNAASATSTSNQRQRLILADYLLYYPFIDTDAVGEEQLMENTVAIPRYEAGQVVAVSQSAASTSGNFTFTYTNQDGVSGRVSPVHGTIAGVSGGGQVVSLTEFGRGFHPYLHLQAGDTGVKSIESVMFTAPGGGLMALVIVKPLFTHIISQECRRTTSGNLESYGSATRYDALIHQAGSPQIKDGAVLGILGQGYAGGLQNAELVGILETHWS